MEKVTIPQAGMTTDVARKLFQKNSNTTLLKNVDPQSLIDLAEICGWKAPDAENAVRYLRDSFFKGMITFKEAEMMKPLMRHVVDIKHVLGMSIYANVEVPNLIIDITDEDRLLFHTEVPMRAPGITQYHIEIIGCNTMADGRRLVSVIFVEGEDRDAKNPYMALAFEVHPDNTFHKVQHDDWNDVWPIDFLTVSKEADGFVPTLEERSVPETEVGEQVDVYDAFGIHCSLHTRGSKLCLELSRDEVVLKRVTFGKHDESKELYAIDDLGSGKTADGKVCLSLSIIEDDINADIPYYVLYAVEIDADGTVHERDYSSWSDGETDSYLVYDADKGGLVNFVGRY